MRICYDTEGFPDTIPSHQLRCVAGKIVWMVPRAFDGKICDLPEVFPWC